MANAPLHDSLAGSRPRATRLVASALLLVISVDYATAAGAVPPDREDVSGTLTRNADEEPLAINLVEGTDAELAGPGELIFLAAIFGGPLTVTEDDGFASTSRERTARRVRSARISQRFRKVRLARRQEGISPPRRAR